MLHPLQTSIWWAGASPKLDVFLCAICQVVFVSSLVGGLRVPRVLLF